MATFTRGQSIVTKVSGILVDAGLPVGQHRFQLEVLTDTGQRSLPDIAVVQVDDGSITLTPIDPRLAVLSPTVETIAPKTVSLSAAPPTTLTKKG